MTLADDILAARGTDIDLGGSITSIGTAIEKAQRFVLSDDVVIACHQVTKSRPASLLSAMPICRLPFPKIWIEWRGSIAAELGLDRPTAERPTPKKMGCLIEGSDAGGQRGQMSWAWQQDGLVMVCGLSVNFDWSTDGDVAKWGRDEAKITKGSIFDLMFKRYVEPQPSDDAVAMMMRSSRAWKSLANDSEQRVALQGLMRHEAPWPSRHCNGLMRLLLEVSPESFTAMLESWEKDITGEAPFATSFIMMLNSRRAVEHEAQDRGKLNHARKRSGKPPLLPYTVTRLYLSAARERAAREAGATSREAARMHAVRGHFKVRASGIYWWCPFSRGGGSGKKVARKEYQVT